MQTPQSQSSRLRKYIPQPERYSAQYGRLMLTARDLAILDTIYRYRFMEALHIRALIPGSDQQITRRLQGLFHCRYVGRYIPWGRMRLDLDPGSPVIAYGLETRGARVLSRHLAQLAMQVDRAPLVRWKKDHTRRTEWFLEHCLMVSHFRCTLELATRRIAGVELVAWDQETIRVARDRREGQYPRPARIAPDAYFAIREPGGLRHFFLEADRSTEEHDRIVRKYERYWRYLQSVQYRTDHANHTRVNVLFVTTGHQRMLNLMETLRRMPKPKSGRTSGGGKGWFRFCTLDDVAIDDPTSVLQSIWRSASTPDETRPLVSGAT